MTHPLTPREKVEHEVLDAVFSGFEHGQCEKEWEPEYGKEIASKATDAILATLASGSGDHAELARLAEAMRSGKFSQGDRIRVATLSEAILAENAALRVQVETEKRLSVENYSRATAMATEAERKLDEAVRIFQQIETHHGIECIPDNEIQAEIRAFLNMEAERG